MMDQPNDAALGRAPGRPKPAQIPSGDRLMYSSDEGSAILWSIAGTDSGGGAGLAADQRAVEAFGLHLCPVVAAVTAQNTVAVTRIEAMSPEMLDAQLAALAHDLPPAVIKTGLLGSADNARVLARWVDRLRQQGPVALVVDPVLRASTGSSFADDALLAAYRDELLPRASVITPNRAEAARLLGHDGPAPQQAQALRELGAQAVCITGGDAQDVASRELSLDWIDTPQAQGWLALPRVNTPHHHGTGCTFASALASALALGFVAADATVLAKMATTQALRGALALGAGAGPVRASTGFGSDPSLLPRLFEAGDPPTWRTAAVQPEPGLYAIVDSAARVQAVLGAGITTVQLRIKDPRNAAWLRGEIMAALSACAATGAMLYINDHWQLALELGATGLHLGQEDLLRLTQAERARLQQAQANGLKLGISSHSLWELARAVAWSPAYIACGPVWPTTTKDMPWRPQGLHNLAWWCAMAGHPVVAIGGLLQAEQFEAAARSGASGACAVRVIGDAPLARLPPLQDAWRRGQAARQAEGGAATPALPQPTL